MSFSSLLDSFRGMKVLVVGDLMLDEYHFGRATRISPEAPVMVIRHEKTTHLPGGAANVALNLKALGAIPVLLGVAGDDTAGNELEKCLTDSGLKDVCLIRAQGRRTTKKTRVVADHSHQVLRMDSEDSAPLEYDSEQQLIEALNHALAGVRAVVISDYLKGVATPKVSAAIIEASSGPVVVNPKPRSLAQYRGSSLISLNRPEAAEALGLHEGLPNDRAESAACELKQNLGVGHVLVTLGEGGMVAAGENTLRVSAPKVEVYDTAGAGDTVVATVALGMAAVGFKKEVFELAAQTAAYVVRHVGVATPSTEDLEEIRTLRSAD